MLRFLFNYWYILGTLNQHKFHCMSTAQTYDNMLLIYLILSRTVEGISNVNDAKSVPDVVCGHRMYQY